jgi:hypothetical protein
MELGAVGELPGGGPTTIVTRATGRPRAACTVCGLPFAIEPPCFTSQRSQARPRCPVCASPAARRRALTAGRPRRRRPPRPAEPQPSCLSIRPVVDRVRSAPPLSMCFAPAAGPELPDPEIPLERTVDAPPELTRPKSMSTLSDAEQADLARLRVRAGGLARAGRRGAERGGGRAEWRGGRLPPAVLGTAMGSRSAHAARPPPSSPPRTHSCWSSSWTTGSPSPLSGRQDEWQRGCAGSRRAADGRQARQPGGAARCRHPRHRQLPPLSGSQPPAGSTLPTGAFPSPTSPSGP